MPVFVRARDINGAWNRILNVIWYSGDEIKSQRGKTREILNMMCHVSEPFDKKIKGFPMSEKELKTYSRQLLSPDRRGFEYTYGERLRAWNGQVDQISEVTKILKKSKSTRRATAVTWIPPVDLKKQEVPCLILVDFKVRNKKLNLTAVFRSNDMYGAWPANVYALNNLNSHVAKKIRLKQGSITTLSVSAHVYRHDFENVKRILRIQ